ncbi:hypothetical protein EVAR_47171_1 [Eumeta japonica]|uniref:Nucleic-acid-binding protein from transposon X-element n=1 Tax=Eumeta variegata TaxID=151549 RepID=A0A4C1WWX0_EUMVA|nr:hypothetical protein EVAR_47171_1 [Eumeta japonica]
MQCTKHWHSELPVNGVTRRYNAPRLFLHLPRIPILRHCGAFVTNFTAAEFRYAFHTYSLKEELENRVILRGVPGKIPIEKIKEDLRSQDLPAQSVRCILNRSREPLEVVLVSGTAETNDKATKVAFSKIKKSQCTRNKDTDGPPACVLCKQKGHTVNYLGCPRVPKRAPPPEKTTPRPVSATLSYAHTAAESRSVPPAVKQNQSSTADDLKQSMSIISIIDNNEPPTLAKKFHAAANPTEKLI